MDTKWAPRSKPEKLLLSLVRNLDSDSPLYLLVGVHLVSGLPSPRKNHGNFIDYRESGYPLPHE